jgi:lipopolysaccharide/colanic/teichoic acid biosynthesis glycosyltransferase
MSVRAHTSERGAPQARDEFARRVTVRSGSPAYLWKRPLDVTLSLLGLLVLSPVLVLAALAIRLSSPGPILFRQVRVGRNERPYTMLKFRTMHVGSGSGLSDREAIRKELEGSAAPDTGTRLYRPSSDPRVTRVGGFLRRFSIDELPQLFNVLRGEMSLVGPRPALAWEVEMFTPEQRRRHLCLPGITGLWQVNGRNRLSSREMLDLDLVYVERASLLVDLRTLLRTPWAVLVDRNTR